MLLPLKDLLKRYLKKVKYIYCDITNKKKLTKKLNQNFDFIVNLAGYVNHKEKIKTYNSHYKGCKNLADIFLKKFVSFLQIGSSAGTDTKAPHSELTKCDIKSNYAKAKLMLKIILIDYPEKINLSLML